MRHKVNELEVPIAVEEFEYSDSKISCGRKAEKHWRGQARGTVQIRSQNGLKVTCNPLLWELGPIPVQSTLGNAGGHVLSAGHAAHFSTF